MDYKRLFTDYRVPFSTKVNRGWTNVACPYCGDKTYNGGFNNSQDYYNCWKCGTHPFRETLAKVLSIRLKDVPTIEKEYRNNFYILNNLNDRECKGVKLELPTDTFTNAERRYLIKRDFDPDYLHRKYQVVGGGISGKWSYRIIIPLIYKGKIVSWTARSLLNKKQLTELKIPRYKNLSIEESVINPKSILYNMDNCPGDTVVLTEGAFDVMRLGDNFLCSFGTSLTQSQIRILSENYKKVYIMFDNEEEAQNKARKYGKQIASLGVDVEVIDAYSDFEKNDGGELNEKEVEIIRKELGFSR